MKNQQPTISIHSISAVAKSVRANADKHAEKIVYVNRKPKYEISEYNGKTWAREYGKPQSVSYSPISSRYAKKSEIIETITSYEEAYND
jgi:hypothetical protein